jgi:hypothetical protein
MAADIPLLRPALMGGTLPQRILPAGVKLPG